MRAGDAAVVDGAAEVEVEVGLDGAGGAEGGDAGGEVEARRGEGHLGDDDGRLGGAGDVEVGAREVVHVVVHADEAGEDGVAGEVEVQGGRAVGAGPGGHVAFVGLHVIGRKDRGDFAVGEDDGGVFEGSGSGAVDDADVVEPEGVFGGVVLDVARDGGREVLGCGILRGSDGGDRESEEQGEGSHQTSRNDVVCGDDS